MWVKLDDGFFHHPKAMAAGPAGRELFLASLCWAAANLTDGVVPSAALPTLLAASGAKARTAERLVEVGLWDRNGSGWVIHDYLAYNASRDVVLTKREADARRQATARAKRSDRW